MRPAVLLWTFFGVLNFAGAANAECVTMNRTADQPYAEYDLVNTCRGSAKVFWTRKRRARQHRERQLVRTKLLDGLLRDHPIEREFNKVFMTTSKEGKQAPIKLIGIGRNATGRKRSER